MHFIAEPIQSLFDTVLLLQIGEDDVTNAAYGSDGSFFASDTVSSTVITLIQPKHK